MNIEKMRSAHNVLSELEFDGKELDRGYANRTLRIDLGSGKMEIRPVTQQMKDLWTGGKGLDLWMMLQEIDKNTKWDSPENTICFSPGPMAGVISFPGSGKTLVTSISPATHSIMDSNVGGFFGPYLKFTGFDGLAIVGKCKKESIIYIDGVNNKVSLEEAPEESIDSHLLAEELTEMYAEDEKDKRNISVVSAGRASEHVRMGVLNFSFYDWRRKVARLKQAGRGGIGTVFRNKKLKAIVIRKEGVTPGWSIEESKVASMVMPKDLNKGSCCCKKEGAEEITEIRDIISQWNDDPEYVIEMMQDIQDRERCISPEAIEELSSRTGVPKAHLFHIATFYKAFSLEKRGETVIQICVGTACHVKGAARILDEFERTLDVQRGGTTSDEKYSLEPVACLGACSIAPVVKFGDEILGNVQVKDIEKILKRHGKKGGPDKKTDAENRMGGDNA